MLIIVNLFDISCLLDFLMLFLGIHQHLTVVESYFVGGGGCIVYNATFKSI